MKDEIRRLRFSPGSGQVVSDLNWICTVFAGQARDEQCTERTLSRVCRVEGEVTVCEGCTPVLGYGKALSTERIWKLLLG